MTRGLLSLVDDLLYRAFDYVVVNDVEDGALNSLKLSHVSQRCRSLALSSPSLWTNICHDLRLCSMAFVEACLQRSGTLPLSVVVTVAPAEREQPHIGPDIFMAAFTEHAANRCKWLRFRYLPRPARDETLGPYRKPLYLDANLWAGDGVFPNLESMEIRFPRLPTDCFFATALWSRRLRETPFPFPKLRALSLQGFTLYHLNGYSNLVKLNFTCTNVGCMHVPDFLASCPSLQDVRMALYLTSNGSIQFVPRTFILPSVRKFRFRLFVDGHLVDDNTLKHIFSQLVFANLPTLRIHVEFLSDEHWRSNWDEPSRCISSSAPEKLDFGKYLKEIIREGNFPSIESLRVSLAAKFSADTVYEHATFSIPVHLLPTLTHLELQSDLLLDPDLEQDSDVGVSAGINDWPSVRVNARMRRDEEWLGQIRGKLDNSADVM